MIRPTTRHDVSALQALVAAVARERRYLGTLDGFTLEQTRDYLAHLHVTGGVALVAVDDGAIVGWADIARGPFPGLTHYGRLGMGVAASARGRGHGRALLARALADGFASMDRIELEVFASNTRAIGLYTHAGFVLEGRRREARRLGDACDDILMFGLLRREWQSLANATTE